MQSDQQVAALKKAGRPFSSPVVVLGLIDTGASLSVIWASRVRIPSPSPSMPETSERGSAQAKACDSSHEPESLKVPEIIIDRLWWAFEMLSIAPNRRANGLGIEIEQAADEFVWVQGLDPVHSECRE
jgi:hypothetical protein